MKEFDLEKAKAGEPVVNNHGLPARIVCFDRHYDANPGFPILALVNSNGNEICRNYSLEGIGLNGDELRMAPEKITLWANVYNVNGHFHVGQAELYLSKEEAISKKASYIDSHEYIDAVKIEVEV